jgi:hypothetical protein
LKRPLILLLVLATLACGKRGDPRPPVPVIPQATSDLLVTQRGSKVILSWGFPALSTAGRTLGPIRRVVVYRYIEEWPVPAGGRDPATVLPGDIDPTLPEPISLFAKLPALTPAQFAKLRQRLDSIEGANLPGATVGTRLLFEDSPPFRSTDGRPVRIHYAVVTEALSAESQPSNLASIVPVDVPLPPQSIQATPGAAGVELKWNQADQAATSDARPFVTGYNIYRTRAGEAPEEFATPVNPAPVNGTVFMDVPPYGDFEYRVSAVAVTGPPRIESVLSNAVAVTFKDLEPPPTPASLTALIETNRVRLIWDRVEAPDLLGYLLHRTQDGTRLKLSAAAPDATTFVDVSVVPGATYTYDIITFDRSGNESPVKQTEPVMVPRTP